LDDIYKKSDIHVYGATEYFCKNCMQLRLNLAGKTSCGNCGSNKLIHGIINELDKDLLIAKYRNR
jgi:hypothetical protein